MTTENDRRHERIKHRADIRVCREQDLVYTLEMRDFSESGLYLLCDDTSIIALDEQITVQTLEFDGAPVLDAKIIRVEANKGFAVEFVDFQ